MASRYQVEVIISSAKDLKNVNWRYGPIRPYAVVWVDPNYKSSTKVDEEGDTCPHWDERLTISLPGPVDGETTLSIDIVHAGDEEATKKLIGSARLKLKEVLDEAGAGERVARTLTLRRPSGRPHGKVEVKVTIIDPRYAPRDAYYAAPYGVPPQGSRDYSAPPSYGYPYTQPPPPPNPYYSTAPPPGGYPYSGYNAPPTTYGQASGGYYGQQEEKKSKFGGMGAGLAVGAVAGVVGGLALAEGADALEDHIADDVAEKVEDDDVGYDDEEF